MANKKRKNVKKQVNKKNRVIIIIILLMLIMVSIVVIFLLNRDKEITCVKEGKTNSGIKQDSEIVVNLSKDKIKQIMVKKKVTVSESSEDIDYLGAVKSTLSDAYKKIGIKHKIKTRGNTIIVDLLYNKRKNYILDNVDILIDNGSIVVNVVSNDRENNYSSINLAKSYDNRKISEIFEKNGYKCN